MRSCARSCSCRPIASARSATRAQSCRSDFNPTKKCRNEFRHTGNIEFGWIPAFAGTTLVGQASLSSSPDSSSPSRGRRTLVMGPPYKSLHQLRAQVARLQLRQEPGKHHQQLIRAIVLVLTVVHEHDVVRLNASETLRDAIGAAEGAPIDRAQVP